MIGDDDEYDLSVVMDATKMPRSEEITERDLQAVEVEAVDDIAESDSYSIDSHVDLEILEQDYEDELTCDAGAQCRNPACGGRTRDRYRGYRLRRLRYYQRSHRGDAAGVSDRTRRDVAAAVTRQARERR